MICEFCKSELKILFTSTYCSKCDNDENAIYAYCLIDKTTANRIDLDNTLTIPPNTVIFLFKTKEEMITHPNFLVARANVANENCFWSTKDWSEAHITQTNLKITIL